MEREDDGHDAIAVRMARHSNQPQTCICEHYCVISRTKSSP